MDTRHHRVEWGGTRSRTSASNWQEPRRWQKKSADFFSQHGRRRRVFCASLADVFDNQVPTEWRDDLWQLIWDCPDLDFLLLTKRPQNIAKMKPVYWNHIKSHIWLGTTVEDQERDRNLLHLCQHDAAVRFVSYEPALGPVDFSWAMRMRLDLGAAYLKRGMFSPGLETLHQLDWVISGGESGPHARPSHPDWFRSVRDQCAAAGVPYLHKQNGEFVSVSEMEGPGVHFTFPDGATVRRIGKKLSGRTIDGVTHDAFPRSIYA